MLVRLGYVALSLELHNASPNKTITWKNLQKIDPQHYVSRLTLLAKENLKNQLRLLKYNLGEKIEVYRFTSKLIPLATHEAISHWAFEEDLQKELAEIGEFVRKHAMRVSFHPDHFVNLNSPKREIVEKSIIDLQYHLRQSLAMGLDEAVKFNIHIGGAYQNKEQSLQRFVDIWPSVPKLIRQRITLENDDKTYTAHDTLEICQQLGIPMVLDIHHHRCNHEHNIISILDDIIGTWKHTEMPAKIHISSPRGTESSAAFRSHADDVDPDDLLPLLQAIKEKTDKLDVMVEAKNKDKALKKLMHQLGQSKEVKIVTEASFEV